MRTYKYKSSRCVESLEIDSVNTNSQKSVQSEDLLVYEFQNPDKVNSGVFFTTTNSLYTNLFECSRFSG